MFFLICRCNLQTSQQYYYLHYKDIKPLDMKTFRKWPLLPSLLQKGRLTQIGSPE